MNTTNIIVLAGFAEIAAGSIAMGLGGYLAAKSDAEHYESEKKREELEVIERPYDEVQEVAAVFSAYGLSEEQSKPVVDAICKNHKAWVDFMMKYELGLDEPDPKRALRSATTIAGSYIAGGLIPLCPYIFIDIAPHALIVSVIITLIALGVFGYIKGTFTGAKPIRSSLQTMLIGGSRSRSRLPHRPSYFLTNACCLLPIAYFMNWLLTYSFSFFLSHQEISFSSL